MNIGVKKLFGTTVSLPSVTNAKRLKIEDNIGEGIHIHCGNFRFDFTIRDFLELERGCYNAVLKILESSGLTKYNVNRSFLIAVSQYAVGIVDVVEKPTRLGNLYAVEHHDKGWRAVSIDKSLVYKYLQGNQAPYRDYVKRFGSFHHGIENLEKLRDSIINNGYKMDIGPIVTFGDEPYIRDGLHRAAILYYLKGDIEVPVLNVRFSNTWFNWRMKRPVKISFALWTRSKKVLKFGVNLLKAARCKILKAARFAH